MFKLFKKEKKESSLEELVKEWSLNLFKMGLLEDQMSKFEMNISFDSIDDAKKFYVERKRLEERYENLEFKNFNTENEIKKIIPTYGIWVRVKMDSGEEYAVGKNDDDELFIVNWHDKWIRPYNKTSFY